MGVSAWGKELTGNEMLARAIGLVMGEPPVKDEGR
jgi:hypothetical protein